MRALREVNLFRKEAYTEYRFLVAALHRTFPVSRQLITAHEMREARALHTYHTFRQAHFSKLMDPEKYLERDEWY